MGLPNELLRQHPPKIENFHHFLIQQFGDFVFKKAKRMTYKKFLSPVLTQSCQNLMKFLVFILLQLCFGIFFHRSNFEVNGYLFFYFCLKKKYKIIFIKK